MQYSNGKLLFVVANGICLLCSSILVAEEAAPAFDPVFTSLTKGEGAHTSAWADYDNDGDLDLAVAYKSGEIRLYRNTDGQFTNVGPNLGLPVAGPEARALAWGDYNQDGLPDLYVGARRGGNELYRNMGEYGFTGVAAVSGLKLPDVNTRQVAWVDYDNSGTLDLFIANRSGRNFLFKNTKGTFEDVSEETGMADGRPAVGACWFDYNQDGFLDVFITNQSAATDALYEGNGIRFRDVAPDMGMDASGRQKGEGGVGCTLSDYNRDGAFDIFVATYGEDLLYLSNGTGGYLESASAQGIAGMTKSVAASWADYDNDGLPDLYISGYKESGSSKKVHGRLLVNTGSSLQETSSDFLKISDHGVQWADYDGDGDLDLSLSEAYSKQGQHTLLQNMLLAGPKKALFVSVLSADGGATQVGAEVRLFSEDGTLIATSIVSSGDGYNAQSIVPVHFGIPEGQVLTMDVTFLTKNGRKVVRQTGIDVGLNQHVTVKKPQD